MVQIKAPGNISLIADLLSFQNWVLEKTSLNMSLNLWYFKQKMQKELAKQLVGAFSDSFNLSDGFPMPVCYFKPAHFGQIFEAEAAYDYCASIKEKLIIDLKGTR